MSRFACVLLPLVAISCADSGGPALVEVEYNLTCPSDVDCGPLAEAPPDSLAACLGGAGRRELVGEHRSMLCGEPLLAICEATRVEDFVFLNLEANIENEFHQFAFEVLGARFDPDSGSMMESDCRVTIIEDEAIYGGRALGACGTEEPSPEQPCQISNVVFDPSEVSFDLRCDALMSDTLRGFDVGGVGSEWATMRFSRCSGF